MNLAAWMLGMATGGPFGVLATGATDGPSASAGRFVENVATWLAVAAISAVISTILTVISHRLKLRHIEDDQAETKDTVSKLCDRVQAMEAACPEHRMRFVTKDELVRVHSAINDLGIRLAAGIDKLDRHSETRVSEVHDRVNEIQQSVGELSGQVQTLRGISQ